MPGMDGLQLTEWVAANRPDVLVVVITSFGSMETAISALRAGAYDFVTKPFEDAVLVHAIERALRHGQLREEVRVLRRAVEDGETLDELLFRSDAMRRVCALVERAAQADASVLITGESGTGKELVARALHRRSQRREGPFVAINCSATPENLLESEFFGHAKGAFTDAHMARSGLFVSADKGTLFLDEIADMPIGLQPKILRALEERRVRPIGGTAEVPFDARIVAATNRDLKADVGDGRFREDLYYRFDVIRIDVPPLRERGQDVLLLAQHFLERFAAQMGRHVEGFSTAAGERLLAYSWPGNVRELRNCVERAVALTVCDRIVVDDLPEHIRAYRPSHVLVTGDRPDELVTLDEVEQRYILRVLSAVDGNKALAARILGLDRKTLYRKLGRLSPSEEGDSE
jgi:two-component system response regulator HydG